MMEKLFIPACELVKKKTQPVLVDSNKIEMERVAMYAYLLTQHLERTKDFKPIIDKFFVANYLNRYLQDKETNWFLNLDRNTAAKVSRKELQRFYVALMNAAFLSSVYLISQYPDSADQVPNARLEKLVPTDIWNLIKNHPYTAAYKGKQNNYDFLAEKIDTVKRLNLYTDLLEKIAGLMRQHVTRVSAERSKQYQEILRAPALYKPKQRVCMRNCLGLPDGTKLFEVDLPVFQLQLAEIGGHLKVVSATSSFQ
jgi:5'(3')-deoxyribonucleotidase